MDEIKRADCASRSMIEAHFTDWLRERGWGINGSFEFAGKIGSKLWELEKQGYLVVLKHDTACSHCGKRWPRKEGEPHLVQHCGQCKKLRRTVEGSYATITNEELADCYDALERYFRCPSCSCTRVLESSAFCCRCGIEIRWELKDED